MINRNINKKNCFQCKKNNTKLYLKGSRCIDKCPLDRANFQNNVIKKNFSYYGQLLENKNKILYIYGLRSQDLKRYINEYILNNKYSHLYVILELRLDSILFRSGIAKSFSHARQLINHKKIIVNNFVINRPSFLLRPNFIVSFKDEANLNIKIATDYIEEIDQHTIKLIDLPIVPTNCLFNNELIKEFYKKH